MSWTWDVYSPSAPPPASGGEGGSGVETPLPVRPLVWHPVRTRIDAARAPGGRFVGVEYTYDYQPSDAEFQESLGANDVVWVPLFDGTIHDPAEEFSRRRGEYEANVRAAAEIGPRVRALLVGNANAEILFSTGSAAERLEKCLTFVDKIGGFVAHHGRPAFAPVFEILLYDCYRGGGRLRDLLNEQKAMVLSFAGASWLFEEAGDHPRMPERRPYPELTDYLGTLDAWSGVGRLEGLRHGSGEVLKSMGYAGGFAGWY